MNYCSFSKENNYGLLSVLGLNSWSSSHTFSNFFFFPVGSREAAFVYAISSAGVVYSIAKACHSGDLANCACDPIKHGYFNDTEGEYSWQGCASFINYSSRFAKRFIDSREGAMTDSRALMNLHNNRAGRKVRNYIIN